MKKFRSSIRISFIMLMCMTVMCLLFPVQVHAAPSFTMKESVIVMHPGETKKLEYTVKGTSSAPEFSMSAWEGDMTGFSISGRTIRTGKETRGKGQFNILLDGVNVGTLTIRVASDPKSVLFSDDERSVSLDDGTVYFRPSIFPYEANYTMVYYSSGDPSVIEAGKNYDGEFIPKKEGTAKIFADTLNGCHTEMTVHVTRKNADRIRSIEAIPVRPGEFYSEYTLKKGETMRAPFKISPSKKSYADDHVYYLSGNEKVAKVDQNGVITAVGAGSTSIQAVNDYGLSANISIAVYEEPKQLKFSSDTYYMMYNDIFAFHFDELLKSDIPVQALPLTWTASNGLIRIGENDGYVFENAVSAGETVITAQYNERISADCRLVLLSDEDIDDLELTPSYTGYAGYGLLIKPVLRYGDHSVLMHFYENVEISNDKLEYRGFGAFYCKEAGTSVVTIKSKDGRFVKQAKVTILNEKPKIKNRNAELKITEYNGHTITGSAANPESYTVSVGNRLRIDAGNGQYTDDQDATIVPVFNYYYCDSASDEGIFSIESFGGGGDIGFYDGNSYGLKALKEGTVILEPFSGQKLRLTVKGNDNTGSEKMYRLYNRNSGEHFYTGDTKEKNALIRLGWKDENVGWIAPKTSSRPVYRLYNAAGGEHHYTMDVREKDALVNKHGWKDEGVGWYSDTDQTVKVYREYNPNAFANNHNYTTDIKEHNALIGKYGWKDEGTAWYAVGGRQ